MQNHHSILIVGGGAGGISVAARLMNQPNPPDVALIEPSKRHYYQPLWTLVGAGVFDKETTARPQEDYVPDGVKWLQTKVKEFLPDENAVVTEDGERHSYDQLVVAVGMQLNWSQVEGLEGNVGKNGIVSNYSFRTVDSTWEVLRSFKGGNAIFTFPATPIKCAGAPQKIMYLADDILRRNGVREKSKVIYAAASAGIFGVQKYARALNKIVERREIETHFRHDLVAIDAKKKTATFRHLDSDKTLSLDYEVIHVVPPQSAPDVVKKSKLANAEGWVEVHKHTLQHVRYPNVFALGDASSLPTSRTGAAVRKQAPVLTENLLSFRSKQKLAASYDGYASCPLITGFGKLILAEFDYDGKPAETFPFDQAQERYSMYALKAYGLPEAYWNGMLRGRM
ncbi:MAG: NAD(P)/FAD-dependent oxidoreductase [Myxococcales bacterium]|nr:NAD(P)/FAD-dependent oxidoreductase [Myxococcales bacterium]MCB9577027.1 NAD(P)/FAD-dependent oxidoreductase [Polyangiaceae bacterium]